MTIRLKSKEHNEPGTPVREGSGSSSSSFYLNSRKLQDSIKNWFTRSMSGIVLTDGPELAFDRIRRKASSAPQLDSRLRKNESKHLTANGRQLLAA